MKSKIGPLPQKRIPFTILMEREFKLVGMKGSLRLDLFFTFFL